MTCALGGGRGEANSTGVALPAGDGKESRAEIQRDIKAREVFTMARGVNKVILLGNLGADPETRYTAGGSAVTNIRMATTDTWRDRQSGEQQERTEWHRIVFFGRLAEIAAEYLRKGSQCYVEGQIRTNKWQGQDGQDRYTTEIIASNMQLLGGRGGGAGGAAPARGRDEGSGSAWPAGGSSAGAPSPASRSGPSDDFDDDIPF